MTLPLYRDLKCKPWPKWEIKVYFQGDNKYIFIYESDVQYSRYIRLLQHIKYDLNLTHSLKKSLNELCKVPVIAVFSYVYTVRKEMKCSGEAVILLYTRISS